MPIHEIKLIDRHTVAKDTVVLEFEKPTGLTFIPGQYGGFTLMKPIEGNATRRFSLLGTPLDKNLKIVTRIQPSSYKNALLAMNIGDAIKFAGPTGNFVLHDEQNIPAVLIAGGIGIAPFYSMIEHATVMNSDRRIILFYGNETLASAAFLPELRDMQHKNSNFNLIACLSSSDNDWQGEKGYITHTLIKKYITPLDDPIYYLCGSLNMVTALKETLLEMDVPLEKIKIEDFPGY